jgi:hypothetical protein
MDLGMPQASSRENYGTMNAKVLQSSKYMRITNFTRHFALFEHNYHGRQMLMTLVDEFRC